MDRPGHAPVITLLLALLTAPFAYSAAADQAPTLTDAERAQLDAMSALWQSLDRRTGRIVLGGGPAAVQVPDGYYFLGPEEARVILEDRRPGPDDGELLGVVVPDRYTPFDSGVWPRTVVQVRGGDVAPGAGGDGRRLYVLMNPSSPPGAADSQPAAALVHSAAFRSAQESGR